MQPQALLRLAHVDGSQEIARRGPPCGSDARLSCAQRRSTVTSTCSGTMLATWARSPPVSSTPWMTSVRQITRGLSVRAQINAHAHVYCSLAVCVGREPPGLQHACGQLGQTPSRARVVAGVNFHRAICVLFVPSCSCRPARVYAARVYAINVVGSFCVAQKARRRPPPICRRPSAAHTPIDRRRLPRPNTPPPRGHSLG